MKYRCREEIKNERHCSSKTYTYAQIHTHTFFNLMILGAIPSKEHPGTKKVKL